MANLGSSPFNLMSMCGKVLAVTGLSTETVVRRSTSEPDDGAVYLLKK
jgi:hypothetical protein